MEGILPFVWAFVIGGAWCVLAQILLDKTKLTPARILVGYVVLGVFLGAVGVYKPLVDFAGAGATTPLTGFGYLISKGVREAVNEKGLLGALTGGLTAAAGGTAAALCFGYLAGQICLKCFKFCKELRISNCKNLDCKNCSVLCSIKCHSCYRNAGRHLKNGKY